ncbi:DUF4336 domain-containing protein [Paraliomyxa miuraensis]|uniref:DUF4336 domain-containing protein n=1 Tax=Paraliomyxa miuraensis TaxID=376150 RepID=UPI0022593FAF|nr:DUF4336 domain-containing protein [Paraliomyxa miuraensis]MCX4242099.1 DUF4336 domain-containing protein [Paraliomyxa miuraensis]
MSTPPDPELVPFVPGEVWIARAPLRFIGVQMGTRMTVCRLASGGLWIHSPVRPTPALCAGLDAIGTPIAVVAPNFLHHLYVGDFVARYDVPAYGSRRLPAKRPDLAFAGVLTDTPEPLWADDFDQVAVGASMLDEVVFHHRRSGTLIMTDMCQQADEGSPLSARLAARLAGFYGRHAAPRDIRWLLRRHRAECKRVIETILSWDFDRMIVAHGALVPTGAKAVFERAYGFVREW